MALNKTDLVNNVAQDTGLSKKDAEKAVKSTMDAISKELSSGGSITLIGFGTFSVMERKARTGKNPRTGESISIAAKKVARFKPGKALSTMVNPVVAAAGKKKAAKKK